MHNARLRPSVFLVAVLSVGLAVVGCSSPSQAPDAPAEEPAADTPSGPNLSLLYTTPADGLVLHDARRDSSRTLVPGAAYDSVQARSASGRYLAFSYQTADSTHLAMLDRTTQTLQSVDARETPVTYSLAWHPSEDRLAFAYYEPAQSGTRGPGDVFVTTPEGRTSDVGCSAAREVLHWLPDGSLATRNDDRLYVVAPSDCTTRASVDARRMRKATYAPTGEHLAYIHRELSYDREANEYTPDSSLFLSDARGRNAQKIFGHERRVRHLRWASDASELAFDVRVEASGHRQIAIYNLGSERTVYLTPPEQTGADQAQPLWSPSGSYVAFTLRTSGGPRAAVRIEGQTRRFGRVDGAVHGWVDDRTLVVPGPDSLRVQTLDGSTEYSQSLLGALIHVWNRDPA